MIERVGVGPSTMFFLRDGRISPPICTGCRIQLGAPGDPLGGRGGVIYTRSGVCVCRTIRLENRAASV